MPAVPLNAAAHALGISEPQLRRWVIAGAPVARRGKRGRGCATLYDVQAIETWRHATDASDTKGSNAISGDTRLLRIAGDVPRLIASALDAAFRECDRRDKRALAAAFAACWYLSSATVLDRLRVECTDVPEVEELPEPIRRLQKIAAE